MLKHVLGTTRLIGHPPPQDVMRHHHTTKNNHWAVGWTGETLPGIQASVLIQVQEDGNQARIPLTPDEAELMAKELMRFADSARSAKPLPVPPELLHKRGPN